MAFWNSELMKQRIPAESLIVPYDSRCVVTGSYELSLGSESYVTSDPSKKKQWDDQGEQVNIPPGQFGMLMTKEVVCIPDDAIGFISIRASIKFRGIVNVSGFHVDPGWKGPLKFAVYNAGSQTMPLMVGERVFLLWFSELTGKTKEVREKGGTSGLTREDIERIQGDVSSPAELKKQVDSLRRQLRFVQAVGGTVVVVVVGIISGYFNHIVERTGSKSETPQKTEIHQLQPSLPLTAGKSGSNTVQGSQTQNAGKPQISP
jgi:dCTP deaminase